jgi:hypothetical protein
LGQFRHRIAGQYDQGNVFCRQLPLRFLQATKQKTIVPRLRRQKFRRQCEHYGQWRLAGQRLLLRVQQRPVVFGALIPAHPIYHRPRL